MRERHLPPRELPTPAPSRTVKRPPPSPQIVDVGTLPSPTELRAVHKQLEAHVTRQHHVNELAGAIRRAELARAALATGVMPVGPYEPLLVAVVTVSPDESIPYREVSDV